MCHDLFDKHFGDRLPYRLVSIEVPPAEGVELAENNYPEDVTCPDCVRLTLPRGPVWVVTAPMLVEVVDGRVVCVSGDDFERCIDDAIVRAETAEAAYPKRADPIPAPRPPVDMPAAAPRGLLVVGASSRIPAGLPPPRRPPASGRSETSKARWPEEASPRISSMPSTAAKSPSRRRFTRRIGLPVEGRLQLVVAGHRLEGRVREHPLHRGAKHPRVRSTVTDRQEAGRLVRGSGFLGNRSGHRTSSIDAFLSSVSFVASRDSNVTREAVTDTDHAPRCRTVSVRPCRRG